VTAIGIMMLGITIEQMTHNQSRWIIGSMFGLLGIYKVYVSHFHIDFTHFIF